MRKWKKRENFFSALMTVNDSMTKGLSSTIDHGTWMKTKNFVQNTEWLLINSLHIGRVNSSSNYFEWEDNGSSFPD